MHLLQPSSRNDKVPLAQMHPIALPYSGGTQANFTMLSSCTLDLEVQVKNEDVGSIGSKMVSVTLIESVSNLSPL